MSLWFSLWKIGNAKIKKKKLLHYVMVCNITKGVRIENKSHGMICNLWKIIWKL